MSLSVLRVTSKKLLKDFFNLRDISELSLLILQDNSMIEKLSISWNNFGTDAIKIFESIYNNKNGNSNGNNTLRCLEISYCGVKEDRAFKAIQSLE